MKYTRTIKIPLHYDITKKKLDILNKLTAKFTYAVNLWLELLNKKDYKNITLEDCHYIQKLSKLNFAYTQQTRDKAIWMIKSYNSLYKKWKKRVDNCKNEKYKNKLLKREPTKPTKIIKKISPFIDFRTGKVEFSKSIEYSPLILNLAILGVTKHKMNKITLLLNPSKYHLNKLNKAKKWKSFEVIKRNNKFYVYLVCEYEVDDSKIEGIRGIDLGINRTITTVLLRKKDIPEPKIYLDLEKQQHINKYTEIIKELQKKNKFKKLRQLSHKRQLISIYYDRVIARQLQKDSGNELVVIGKLKGIRNTQYKGSNNKRLRKMFQRWTYGRITQFITQKYEEIGVKTILTNERGTSKTCNYCNSTDTERLTQNLLVCNNCKTSRDADINASFNFANICLEYATNELAFTKDDFLYKGMNLETSIEV